MPSESLRAFRDLLDTRVKVLQFIPEHEQLLAEADVVAARLTQMITWLLSTFDVSSAPESVRPGLQAAAEKLPVFGLMTHCLLFGSPYRMRYDNTIDFDAFFSEWTVKTLTASSAVRQHDKDNQGVPTAVFNAVFETEVEPVQRATGLGWWRRTSCLESCTT